MISTKSRSTHTIIGLFAAAGLLLASVIGTVMGVASSSTPNASWWHAAAALGSIVTWMQWVGIVAWAAATGALIAVGCRRRPIGPLLAASAFGFGAVVPIGLVLLAGTLNQVWPGTTGPMDNPLLTITLLAYSLIIPWTLGHLLSRFP